MKVITIDGASGSGKTAVAKLVAETLGWSWVCSGTFFRACHFIQSESSFKVFNWEDIFKENSFDVYGDNLYFNGDIVSRSVIYSDKASIFASKICTHSGLRRIVKKLVREHALRHPKGVVVEGRDVGAEMIPEANLKIVINSSQENRVERKGKIIELRDELDSGVLVKPSDCFNLNGDNLSIESMAYETINYFANKEIFNDKDPETD